MQISTSRSVSAALLAVAFFAVAPVLGQPPAFPGAKTLDSGPDPIATGQAVPSQYIFTISLNANNFDPAQDVFDTVPAEFDVVALVASCGAASYTVPHLDLASSCKLEPQHIVWDLDFEDLSIDDPTLCDPGDVCACDPTTAATLQVTLATDWNPGHCKRGIPFYEPTSCGPLSLNDGAFLFDPTGVQPTTDISNTLSVAACDADLDADCQTTDTDNDNDGWSVTCGDCADGDPAVSPGAMEICNGIDDNCDGQIDEGGLCGARGSVLPMSR